MDNDLNKFDSLGKVAGGCSVGNHLPDMQEGHSSVEKDGDLTKLKFRCVRCGAQIETSAPLGINDYIKDNPNEVEQPIVYSQPQERLETVIRNDSDARAELRRRLGL